MSHDMTSEIDVRIEWRRFAPGQWHRVRRSSSIALCRRRVVIANAAPRFERRGDSYRPSPSMKCQGCEQAWPMFRWAVARLRRQRRTTA